MNADKIVYCQIDAHLDTNPKIRRGGRDARDVFEFLLRRVAIGRTQGTVPLKYVEPWYLADQLMMTEDEARHGTSRAVTVRLIEIDEANGVVRIVGWSEEWGRRPKEGKERTAAWRERTSKASESHHGVTDGDAARRDVTLGDGCDVGDVGEERRGEDLFERAPPAAPQTKAKPSRKPPKTPLPPGWEPSDAHRRKAESLRIDLRHESMQFTSSALANGRTYADWDQAFHTWLGNAAKWRDERGGPRTTAVNHEIRPTRLL